MDRTVLLYALLFSIPPGIIVLEFTVALTGGSAPVTPLGLAVGGGAAALLFLLVVVGASGEDPAEFEDPVG